MPSMVKSCRVCLQQGEISVFSKNNPLDFPLSHYLKLICNIDISTKDTYPQNLCQSCSDALDTAIKLRKTAMKSQLQLKILSLNLNVNSNLNLIHQSRYRRDSITSPPLKKRMKKEFKDIDQIDYDCHLQTFSSLHKEECNEDIDQSKNNGVRVFEQLDQEDTNCNSVVSLEMKEINKNSEIPILTLEQLNKVRTKDILYSKYYEKVFIADKKPQYRCRICRKVYKKGSIADHLLIHLPDSVSLYVCEVCGKTFKKFCSFYKHRIIHKNILPFECKVCPYKGRSKDLLQVHIKRVHKKEYNYQCTVCSKKFLDTNNLRYHLRRHEEPKFKCNACHKSFYENGVLKKHIQSQHTDCIPHKCDICGNLYKDRKNLLSHQIKIHKRKQIYNNRATYLKLDKLESRSET